MKKCLLAVLLALVMCLGLLAVPVCAAEQEPEFTVDDNGVLTKTWIPGTTAVVPDGVTTIGYGAFWGKKGLHEVTLPDGLVEIGLSAFYRCENMTSINIPGSVTTIGENAFASCGKLTSVTLPDGLTTIGRAAFGGCESLTEITIPDSVTSVGDQAFMSCKGLTSVQIGSGVTSISPSQFSSCINLTGVTVPEGVTIIEGYAFWDCYSLTDVDLPDSLTTIGDKAFGKCAMLKHITIPKNVTTIGSEAFANCYSLASVTIPSGVDKIDLTNLFYGCTSIKDIYYGGTDTQWRKAVGLNDNYADRPGANALGATIHFNSTGPGTGTTEPTTPTTPTQPTTPTTPTQPTLPTVENIPAAGTAVARTQTAKLDGKSVSFQYYAVKDANGNESNYVKVRDLANALNGTKAQFDVGWDQASKTISIIPNTAYQVKGGEGTTPYSGNQPYKAVSDDPVSFNGSSVKLTSFQLKDSAGNGYTYYKLRDLGQLLNFNVKWDNASKSVVIETDKPFTGK